MAVTAALQSCETTPFPTLTERTLKTISGSAYIPMHDEDSTNHFNSNAHFIVDARCTIGVADGIGGWNQKGVDAGEHARQLMANAALYVQSHQPEYADDDIDPTTVLTTALSKTNVEGSSTACVITITCEDRLRCLNVGENGFVVMRLGRIAYQSSQSVGEEIEVKVEPWDVIVVGTNGLLDNVLGFEIEELVNEGVADKEMPEKLAWKMAMFASEKACGDGTFSSPYAQTALAAGYENLERKYDDITVIVAYVVPTV